MIAFAEIESRAIERKGDLAPLLHNPLPAKAIAAIPDDRWLSQMTRCIFEAGFNWDLIDKRWPQFETAFEGFDVTRWVFMSDDDLDHLLKASGLVANAQKIRSVGENARFISDIGKTHGSAGAWFAEWPAGRYMEQCLELKARGSRLGGTTGQRMMRRMGVDALILTPTVIKALNHWGVIAGEPTSKKAFLGLQTVLDDWRTQSGPRFNQCLNHISQILAWSID